MSSQRLTKFSLAALAGASLLALVASPSSALTLSGPLAFRDGAAPRIERVWYDSWGNWREHRHHFGHHVADPDPDQQDGPRRCWAQGVAGDVNCRSEY